MYRSLVITAALALLLAFGFNVLADKTGDIQTADLDQLLEQARVALAARAGEEINWQVISSGGTEGSSASYKLMGTVGQTAVGSGSSASFGLNHGYWQDFAEGCCIPPLRGNVDYDPGDNIDISDLVYLVDYMFTGGPPPPCFEEADMNCDGSIDISDLVYLVDYMFNQGPPPCRCDCADCP